MFIKAIYHQMKLYWSFFKEAYSFFVKTIRYNASSKTDEDIVKMQYTLLRENHTIEKGMSMRNPRKGFGQSKVINLLNRLDKYAQRYISQDSDFLCYPLSTISEYISFIHNQGVEIREIESSFNNLLEKYNVALPKEYKGGVYRETKRNIQSLCNKDFASLLSSRHSIRYFSDTIPSIEIIEKALVMAQKTPSACNRQGWKTHVYFGSDSTNLIKWQGGSRGFEDEIKCSIIVTADLKAFLSYEVHQAYVDGGLYAMNLINSIHSLGLGCIPLSLGFSESKLRELSNFGIPANEVPILIVGVGELLDSFNVAVSTRKNISATNTFHNLGNEHFSC